MLPVTNLSQFIIQRQPSMDFLSLISSGTCILTDDPL